MDPSTSAQISNVFVKEDTEYIKALLLTMYYEQSEHIHSEFSEAYLKFRNVVCEWMIDVCEYFHLHITTTHAAICYLDRLQPNEKFSRFEWQMMAICCIVIASKYNECEEHVPPLKQLGEITQQQIENSILLEYELFALKRMAWKLNVRSSVAFLCSYVEMGLLTKEDIHLLLHRQEDASNEQQGDENSADNAMKVAMMIRAMRHKIQKLSTKVLLDARFKSIQCSAVAAAIMFYARRCCCLFSSFGAILPAWNDELTKLTFHNPLTHRATIQALSLIFEMEGESIDDLQAILPTGENITSTGNDIVVETSSPVKSENHSSILLESPVATACSAPGKQADLSPVSMTSVFASISP
jgi:hypothetical protein